MASLSPGSESHKQRVKPLFMFGVISDVQYADIPDGHSFHGTPRYYRASLEGLHRAVQEWRQQEVNFAMHLGDLIDGFNPKDTSQEALQRVKAAFAGLRKQTYHTIGNHDLYNLQRPVLNEQLQLGSRVNGHVPGCANGNVAAGSHVEGTHADSDHTDSTRAADNGAVDDSYYAFSPNKDWLFVVLDSYDVSVLGWPCGHPKHDKATAILDAKNKNKNKNNPEGHRGVARRFVAFGGGISEQQLDWFKQQLATAKDAGQKVVVATHLPLHPDTCPGACLLWNYEEVLQAIWDAGNVVATLTGHTHQDNYVEDDHGVHHRVLHGVLETRPPEDCFGVVEVYPDRLQLTGYGQVASTLMDIKHKEHGLHEPMHSHDLDANIEEEVLERQPTS